MLLIQLPLGVCLFVYVPLPNVALADYHDFKNNHGGLCPVRILNLLHFPVLFTNTSENPWESIRKPLLASSADSVAWHWNRDSGLVMRLLLSLFFPKGRTRHWSRCKMPDKQELKNTGLITKFGISVLREMGR